MPTENLLHVVGHFIALVGAIPLDHWRQQAEDFTGACPFFLGLGFMGQVFLQSTPQTKRSHAFVENLAVHQHPTNIRVYEDRIGFSFRVDRAGKRPALSPVQRIGHGVLISDFCLGISLHTYA